VHKTVAGPPGRVAALQHGAGAVDARHHGPGPHHGRAVGERQAVLEVGGSSAETGFDCSGFVRATYEQTIGLVLPRRANEQAAATQIIDRTDLKPGDLVFFNTMRRAFSHVGIYVGDGKFIHAPRAGAQVRVEDMREAYWRTRFNGARRVAGGSSSGE
jgi:cell wall-associated NlpC family hydrolase